VNVDYLEKSKSKDLKKRIWGIFEWVPVCSQPYV